MSTALLAGVPIAALAGLVGYFMVLRGQVFTGDALSHVAFTGALAALAWGIDPRLGLFVATIGVAAAFGLLGERGRADDVVIGTVFAWVLGLGVLALSVYAASARGAGDATAGVTVLFGSILGLSDGQAAVAAAIAIVLFLLVLLLARPLLFASLDEAVAAARGVPVRALGIGFLLVVGAERGGGDAGSRRAVAAGSAGRPRRHGSAADHRPFVGMALSCGVSVVSMVGGLVISDVAPSVPPSFAILAIASGVYAMTFVIRPRRARMIDLPNPA